MKVVLRLGRPGAPIVATCEDRGKVIQTLDMVSHGQTINYTAQMEQSRLVWAKIDRPTNQEDATGLRTQPQNYRPPAAVAFALALHAQQQAAELLDLASALFEQSEENLPDTPVMQALRRTTTPAPRAAQERARVPRLTFDPPDGVVEERPRPLEEVRDPTTTEGALPFPRRGNFWEAQTRRPHTHDHLYNRPSVEGHMHEEGY